MELVNVSAKFAVQSVALPVPEIIAITVLGRGCEAAPNLGEDEAIGVGDSTVRKNVSW